MTWTDYAFLLASLPAVALCLFAAAQALRQAERYRGKPNRRRRGLKVAALMVVLALFILGHAVHETQAGAGVSARLFDWVWRLLYALIPGFFLIALSAMRERDMLEAELAAAAEHDPLTGLPNRAGLRRRALAAVSAAQREDAPLVAVMLDVDHFKAVNDGWGHPAGDTVLRGVARVARESLRAQDVLGRVGGEEFALVLPGLTPGEAQPLVDRLRAAITAEVPHPGAPARQLTLSAGIAAIEGAGDDALERAFQAADGALYAAKQAGRNRAFIAG